MEILNENSLDEKFIWRDDAGLITQFLGAAAGSQKLYVNIDKVPPKAFSTKYHSHSQQEEFFMILEGSGKLRLNGTEYTVKKEILLQNLPLRILPISSLIQAAIPW